MIKENEVSEKIIGLAIEMHKILGPGLLESTYEECFCRELNLNKLSFERQIPLPVEYKGIRLDCGYRLDLVVENCVIVELKSIEALLSSTSNILKINRNKGWITYKFQCPYFKRWDKKNCK